MVIISFEGKYFCELIVEGEGLAIVDLDFFFIVKCKCMMDLVGYYV